jgi:meso-butanediol dehydrogenase/(S,S)-butanediol dehydrogenase/diacetyl reductase
MRVGKGCPLALDLSNEASCIQCIQKSVELLSGIDVLINNAGTMAIGLPLEKTTLQEWEHIMFVNLTAPFLLIREATPFLKQSKGNVVNVSSIGMCCKTYSLLLCIVIVQKHFSFSRS